MLRRPSIRRIKLASIRPIARIKPVILPQEIDEVRPETLKRLQEKSKAEHSKFVIVQKILGIEDIIFFDGIHIPSVKMLFTPAGYLKPVQLVKKPKKGKRAGRPKIYERTEKPTPIKVVLPKPEPKIHIPAYVKQLDDELPPDWKRTPAQYTNIPSPYGIATEMLQEQIKEDRTKKVS